MALKPLPRFYEPICNEKQKSFTDTVKCSFSKILLIGDSIVSSLTRYPMTWFSTLNHMTPLILIHLGDGLVMWRVQQRGLRVELEIAVI